MDKEKNKFCKRIDSRLSECDKIVEFDNALLDSGKTIVVHQANQSIKTILVSRAFAGLGKHIFYITKDDKLAEDIAEDFTVLNSEHQVFFIPDYETLPYEERSPHYMLQSQRMRAFANLLSSHNPAIYILSFRNLIRNVVNPRYIYENIMKIKHADEHDPSDLIKYLLNCGYENTSQIEKVGQFSKRGGILDIFSPNYNSPIRFEFFGDEIVSIRHFDVSTQRSQKQELKNVAITPCREVILNEEAKHSELAGKIAIKGYYEGIEADIPLIYKGKYSLFDYLRHAGQSGMIFFDNFTFDFNTLSQYYDEINEIYNKQLKNNKERKIAKPEIVILSQKEIEAHFKNNPVHFLNTGSMYFTSASPPSLFELELSTEPSPFFDGNLNILESHIKQLADKDYKIFIQNENEAQLNRISQLLTVKDPILTIGVLHKGFIFHDAKLAVFTDHEIFKRVKHKKLDPAFSKGEALIDYESLKPGDYIVHIEHGIGIYEGIKTLESGGRKIECLCIQYAGTDRVYVPTWQLKLVAKYVSEEGVAPTIHKLGTKTWDLTKQKARKNIELVMDDIIQLYAERKVRKGIVFKSDSEWQTQMEQSFIYEDTPDQTTATKEIKADMELDVPMERLLCGDVGFGKTEVAIRVAFKAVMSGYQVAVLVPTTLLAEQHYQVFRERLAQFPVNITMLSRFRTDAQINRDIEKIKSGSMDIVIGTHRILSDDVTFKNIGLLIIDEEHRFGVNHKEMIRKMKANIDTLYMSATPIPRTMNMILSKLKSMSLIQTSPAARLPIRTVIVPFDYEIIKDAIQREIDRSGQVFFLHNRVETINTIYNELRSILPKVRIVIGHGQLPERQLEKVMMDFANHEYDVLLATTIIESGIDIPNANTIIVNRADKFGLAQLYQIRGRVVRSNRRSYAYLTIPNQLTDIARKRLETLTEYESLGAGYQIAMRDLEIRGAGTLLGNKQSGIITSVGFNFYNKLLDQAVNNILKNPPSKDGGIPENLWDENDDEKDELRQIELGSDFYFPVDFITDEKQKLQIYKRMVNFEDDKKFDELAIELKDRFGSLPQLAENVLEYFKMRVITKRIGLKTFVILQNKMILEFYPTSVPPRKVIAELISTSEIPVRFDTTGGLKMVFDFDDKLAKDKQGKIAFGQKIVKKLNM